MRLFVGIPLPEATRIALADAGDSVRAAEPRWRDQKWVSAENLHITLAFLGELPEEIVPQLTDAIAAELAGIPRFVLPFTRLAPAPNSRRATMLWAWYDDPNGECAALADAIGRAAAGFGVVCNTRAFRAHVTLARARRPLRTGARVQEALTAAQMPVPGFVSVLSATLFSSTLSKAGPHYETLETWQLPA